MPATTSRPVRERLESVYLRRSKRRSKIYVTPFQQGCVPQRESEFDRKTWDYGPDGKFMYPVQDEESDESESSDQEAKKE